MELYSKSVSNAVQSWKDVQALPNYKELVGGLLFREIFEIKPGAINLYHFGEGIDERNLPETLFKSPLFVRHTSLVVETLETALVMMQGKDMEKLAATLEGLGERHVRYGVKAAHYIVVETALLRTLEIGLGDKWSFAIKKDWAAVFKFVARAMMIGAGRSIEIVKTKRRNDEQAKVATLRLKAMAGSRRTTLLSRSRFGGDERSSRNSVDPPRRHVQRVAPDDGAPIIPRRSSVEIEPIIRSHVGDSQERETSSKDSHDDERVYMGKRIQSPTMPKRTDDAPILVKRDSLEPLRSYGSTCSRAA